MDKIFVAIASYRDRECQWTVKDLFEAARFPERIGVGICWQFDAKLDRECFEVPYPRPEQVRVVEVGLKETRGACWAKSVALSLLRDETYVLLIDSHMRFAPDWDVEMIGMLDGIDNPRAFLSTYPAGYEPPNQRRFSTPRLAPVKFFDRVMSQDSVLLDMPRPMPSYLVAGGYLFGRRAMFEEVPYDPHIYFIGEEITHAARYYTHGWDGFTPHKCLIHHHYSRESAARHWQDEKDHWGVLNKASYRRVRHLLGIERTDDHAALAEIGRYGLGNARSLAQFQAVIGVNFNAMLIDRKRQQSIAAIEESLNHPAPPQSAHEMALLTLHACRHGHFLFPKQDAYIGKSMISCGEWTEGVVKLMAHLCPPGARVVEIGAGFGAHTVPLARLVGDSGAVTAVEQSRRMVDLLHANLALNQIGNVEVVHAHAGSMPGSVVVSEPRFDSEGNFGVIAHRKNHDAPDGVPVQVPDHEHWGAVDCLVIDTPGQGHEILLGSQRLIATHKPAILLNADNAADAEKAGVLLQDCGYHLWRHVCPFFVPDNFFMNGNNPFGGFASISLAAVADDRDLGHLGATRLPPTAAAG